MRRALSPAAFCGLMLAYFGSALALDTVLGLHEQLLLGGLTWIVLLLACRRLPTERRAQVAVVVVAATCAEITGSFLWGVYTYRLGNLPSFVPPGHGLIYVTGLTLSQTGLARWHADTFVRLAVAGAVGWGIAGLTVLPRTDVAGALGVPLLVIFLLRSRARAVYAGVFLAVAALELYGTAIGTWHWAETLPGLGVPDGNPPSGAASGYVCFDITALALAPRLLTLARAARRVLPLPAGAET